MEDDKNRLGEKLRDKGKATEDLYIAEQERKRLEKLKQAGPAVVELGRCPKDGDKLLPRTDYGVTIDICPTCRGVWLEEGELGEILKHQDEAAITRWVRSLLKR